jgi:hypothetical protein
MCRLLLVLGALQAPNPPLAEVPFTLHQNAIILSALINGRDTVHLLLDTGWGPIALVSATATRLGLTVTPPGADGLGHADVTSLSIGHADKTRPLVEVFPTENLAPLIGPHDGILGTEFFRDFAVQIDYPARILRFYRRALAPTGTYTSVPMVFAPVTGALPYSDSIWVDGRPVRGLFDTGGAGAFLAMRRFIERAQLQPVPDSGSGQTGIGMLSGDTVVRQLVRFTRVGRIAVGGFAVDSPRVILAPPQLAGQDWGHDLVIGYGFFRHYVVTFDYPARRVTFARP